MKNIERIISGLKLSLEGIEEAVYAASVIGTEEGYRVGYVPGDEALIREQYEEALDDAYAFVSQLEEVVKNEQAS
jgi:hypothetical protein